MHHGCSDPGRRGGGGGGGRGGGEGGGRVRMGVGKGELLMLRYFGEVLLVYYWLQSTDRRTRLVR
jgi:hypothetical protein